MALDLDKTPYLGPLKKDDQEEIYGSLEFLYNLHKEKYLQRIIDLYLELQNVDRIILVARQGVPINYMIKGFYEALNLELPSISVLSHVRNFNRTYEIELVKEIFDPSKTGKKIFIDGEIAGGLTKQNLLSIAQKIDPKSKYSFFAFDNYNGGVFWDIFSVPEYHEFQHANWNLNVPPLEAHTVIPPVENNDQEDMICASYYAQVLYELGQEAARLYKVKSNKEG